MKTTSILGLLLLPMALAVPDAADNAVPYELVLTGDKVVFENAESVSSPLVVRDLGEKKLSAPDLYWGLSVIWDGEIYKRDPAQTGRWNGPAQILPKTTWRTVFSLSEFLVPETALTPGRHTIALKDNAAKSNALTVFIEKAK